MFSDIKIVGMSILFLIIGAGIGALAIWGMQRVKIADLERKAAVTTLEKENMKGQWKIAINELNATRVVLNDTYAALELLKKYQSIDRDIQENIDTLDPTFDKDGNATEDTYNAFRKMMEEFNQLQGNVPTASNSEALDVLAIDPFTKLREEAEKLFKQVTNMVLEYEQ